MRVGRLHEAEAEALKAVSLSSSKSPWGYVVLGNVLLVKKDYAGAEQAYRAALSKAPENPGVLNNLGLVLEGQGRTEEAKQFFAAAMKSNPNLYKVKENLMRLGG